MIVKRLAHLRDWYEQNEKRVSVFSLAAGFVFDSLTLSRIDSLRDNLWLGVNLVSIGVCIILLHREEHKPDEPGDTKKHFWIFNIMQFSFGALLGASFIFYFRSATLSVSWPFLALLLVAMVANEVLKRHYDRLIFQISFLYLSIFVFAIFLVPVLFHRIGPLIFLLSGTVSLIVLWGFMLILKKFSKSGFLETSRSVYISVVSIFVIFNILYFINIIPPIPLALKGAGIYHSVSHTVADGYAVSEEKRSWLDYLRIYRRIHLVEHDPLYAYSAVFSPAELDTNIVHEWQYENEFGEWVTSARIPLRLFGGRDEGFRTYSVKSNLAQGKWRVNVTTTRGAVIGRINFRVIETSDRPELEVKILR